MLLAVPAAVFWFFAAGGFLRGTPIFPTYEIEAYLDRAPEGAVVLETVTIGQAGSSRSLLVVKSQRFGVGPSPLREGTFGPDPRFQLVGAREAVEKILGSPPVTRVSGIFVRMRMTNQLIVQRLEALEPPPPPMRSVSSPSDR